MLFEALSRPEYQETVAPERIVYTEIFDQPPYDDQVSYVTVVLTEQNGWC